MMMNTNTIASSTSPATSGGGSGGSNSGGGGGGGSGGGGPCGACKFLRRKCVVGCIFAPYFDSEQGAAHFAAVHKVFGASNVSKLLLHIPVHKRLDAVVTITYEAQSRLKDPVYGCVAQIFALQQQIVNLQAELSYLHAHLATMEPPPQPSAPPQPQPLHFPPTLTIQDLPPAPNVISLLNSPSVPTSFDLSTLFEPVHVNPPWAPHPRQHPFSSSSSTTTTTTTHAAGLPSTSRGGGDDLHELARELFSSSQAPSSSSAMPPHSN